ncbi:MAG: thioesterase [Myxococcales bacterium]|jgi:medium-chain acyl-[acyl-carrier-protein] hydrolase|nr:thioesterase [Myxococcales bacterium]
MNPSKLFPFRRALERPRLRLFCLPYAGGSAAMYRPWVEAFGPEVEVCPVEMAGRGVRMAEPPVRDMKRLCDFLVGPVAELAGQVPIVFFGHSMGARISFELACRLGDKVRHLVASGSSAPEIPARLGAEHGAKPIALLTDEEFRLRLRTLGGTPLEILDNDEMMERVLPVVRADFILVERYRAAPQAQLSVPLTVLRGTEDPGVSYPDAERWQLRTSAAFRLKEISGGHFFLESQRDAVLAEVKRDLSALLAG